MEKNVNLTEEVCEDVVMDELIKNLEDQDFTAYSIWPEDFDEECNDEDDVLEEMTYIVNDTDLESKTVEDLKGGYYLLPTYDVEEVFEQYADIMRDYFPETDISNLLEAFEKNKEYYDSIMDETA